MRQYDRRVIPTIPGMGQFALMAVEAKATLQLKGSYAPGQCILFIVPKVVQRHRQRELELVGFKSGYLMTTPQQVVRNGLPNCAMIVVDELGQMGPKLFSILLKATLPVWLRVRQGPRYVATYVAFAESMGDLLPASVLPGWRGGQRSEG